MTTPLDLGPIKEREARATKPPWFLGMLGSRFCLFRDAGMREIILDAARKGMNDATLRLRDHRLGVMIPGSQDLESHPDAEYLRHARTDIPLLVAEVERLRAEVEAEERSHGQTIDDRDALHERIDEIADALGDETEWSNANDRGANAVELAQEALGRLVDLHIAVEPVRSWFDGDGEVATPSDVEIVEMAVEELQKDREEVLRLRAAMNQIIATASEPVIKHLACKAMGESTP